MARLHIVHAAFYIIYTGIHLSKLMNERWIYHKRLMWKKKFYDVEIISY